MKSFTFYINVLIFSTLITFLGYLPYISSSFLGLNLTGYGWFLVFITSIIYILFLPSNKKFKSTFIIPWLFYLIISLIINYSFQGLQLTLQYIVPFLVFIVMSRFEYTSYKLILIFKKIKRAFILCSFFLIIAYVTGRQHIGADFVMFVLFIATLLLSLYFYTKNTRFLIAYIITSLFPVLLVTRMAILLIVIVYPFHFANTNKFKKVRIIIFALLAFSAIFFTETVQKKMFISGSGSITDLFENSENINTSGRTYLAKTMEAGLSKNPVFGNGPRFDYFLFVKNRFEVTEAHNDYLSIRYNYGYFGLILFLLTITMLFIKVYRGRSEDSTIYQKILTATSLTLIIPLLGFMFTDNIVKYSSAFCNFYFGLIGIIFSLKNQKINTNQINNTI